MPHKVDFSRITNIKRAEIQPKGWISPMVVEYGIGMHYNTPSYFWRIQGSQHTFVIPINRFEFLSSGDYSKHFEMTLKGFREEYLEWNKKNFELDWMKEYRDEYSKFIII